MAGTVWNFDRSKTENGTPTKCRVLGACLDLGGSGVSGRPWLLPSPPQALAVLCHRPHVSFSRLSASPRLLPLLLRDPSAWPVFQRNCSHRGEVVAWCQHCGSRASDERPRGNNRGRSRVPQKYAQIACLARTHVIVSKSQSLLARCSLPSY